MINKTKRLVEFIQESQFPEHVKEALLTALQLEVAGSGLSEFSRLVSKYANEGIHVENSEN